MIGKQYSHIENIKENSEDDRNRFPINVKEVSLGQRRVQQKIKVHKGKSFAQYCKQNNPTSTNQDTRLLEFKI